MATRVSSLRGSGPLRFTGQQLDPESGLYYYGGRYYDPELGRFISPDPFIGQPDDPQNHNRYSYVINNPVNNIDPDGYFHQVKKKKKKGGFFGKIFGGLKIVFGIFQLLTSNPMGFFNIASGASSFSSSKGAQIFSHITGFVGAFSSLPGGEGPPGGGGGSPFAGSLFNLSPALQGGNDGVGGGGLGGFGVFASLGSEVFSLVDFLKRSRRPEVVQVAAGPPGGAGKFPNTLPPDLQPNHPPPECPLGADSCFGGNRNPMNVDMQPSPTPGGPGSSSPPRCPGHPRCMPPEKWNKPPLSPPVTNPRGENRAGDIIFPNGWWIPRGGLTPPDIPDD